MYFPVPSARNAVDSPTLDHDLKRCPGVNKAHYIFDISGLCKHRASGSTPPPPDPKVVNFEACARGKLLHSQTRSPKSTTQKTGKRKQV